MTKPDPTSYEKRLNNLLQSIHKVKMEIYRDALALVADHDSYSMENTTETDLKSGIEALSLLLNLSGEDVSRHLETLYDLTDEDYVNIYPLTLLTFEAKDKIRVLTEIMGHIQHQCHETTRA